MINSGRTRRSAAYPDFERERPWSVCGRFCRATALAETNRYDSFNGRMGATTLHAYIVPQIVGVVRPSR